MSVLPPFSLRRPETIDEALETISFDDLPLGGGTELLLAMRMRMLRPDSLVAITRIPELQSIEIDGGDLVLVVCQPVARRGTHPSLHLSM